MIYLHTWQIKAVCSNEMLLITLIRMAFFSCYLRNWWFSLILSGRLISLITWWQPHEGRHRLTLHSNSTTVLGSSSTEYWEVWSIPFVRMIVSIAWRVGCDARERSSFRVMDACMLLLWSSSRGCQAAVHGRTTTVSVSLLSSRREVVLPNDKPKLLYF